MNEPEKPALEKQLTPVGSEEMKDRPGGSFWVLMNKEGFEIITDSKEMARQYQEAIKMKLFCVLKYREIDGVNLLTEFRYKSPPPSPLPSSHPVIRKRGSGGAYGSW